MSTTAISDKPVFDRKLNVVIIYDDFAGAAKVNAILERVLYRAGDFALWDIKPWRLDLLKVPAIATEALQDTADARLIVLALRTNRPNPVWLFDWLEQWASQRLVGEAALAVFIGGNGGTPEPPIMPELPQFAERHGLNFISDNRGHIRAEIPNLPGHEAAAIPPGSQIVDEEFAYEHWGINE